MAKLLRAAELPLNTTLAVPATPATVEGEIVTVWLVAPADGVQPIEALDAVIDVAAAIVAGNTFVLKLEVIGALETPLMPLMTRLRV